MLFRQLLRSVWKRNVLTIEVSAPATSANLGPGYDSFGMALDLSDSITAVLHDEPVDLNNCVKVSGEGEGQLPTTSDHLIHRVTTTILRDRGIDVGDRLTLDCVNAIPQSRGMGSSAASVVAGVSIADVISEHFEQPKPSAQDKLRWAIHFEGHPDNAAPALFGGVSVSWVDGDGQPVSASLPVHPSITAVLIVPDTRLDTQVARDLLPEVVPHADAAANSACAGLLVHAIGNDPSLLFEATVDRLHQEYRRSAMPESLARVDALRDAGLAAVVSGAGPTVAVLGTEVDLLARCEDILSGDESRMIAASIADSGVVVTSTPR